MDRLRHSFLSSQKLWEHMKYLVSQGSMYLVRDRCLIFHSCVEQPKAEPWGAPKPSLHISVLPCPRFALGSI